MAEDEHVMRIKGLMSYVSKRKTPWAVAVYDKKTKKRAVGDSLAEVLLKLGEHSDDLVVIDHTEWRNQNAEANNEETL